LSILISKEHPVIFFLTKSGKLLNLKTVALIRAVSISFVSPEMRISKIFRRLFFTPLSIYLLKFKNLKKEVL